MTNNTPFLIALFVTYFLFARAWYINTFIHRLMYFVGLLIKIENKELFCSNANGLMEIAGDKLYLHYKSLYQKYQYNRFNKGFKTWVNRNSLFAFIYFPIHLYVIYRVNKMIKTIEKEN